MSSSDGYNVASKFFDMRAVDEAVLSLRVPCGLATYEGFSKANQVSCFTPRTCQMEDHDPRPTGLQPSSERTQLYVTMARYHAVTLPSACTVTHSPFENCDSRCSCLLWSVHGRCLDTGLREVSPETLSGANKSYSYSRSVVELVTLLRSGSR